MNKTEEISFEDELDGVNDASDAQKTIAENLPQDNHSIVESDAALLEDDGKSLARHNKQYSELLEAYVANTKKSMKFKRAKKKCVFDISMRLFRGVPVATALITVYCVYVMAHYSNVQIADILPGVFTAFGSLVATYVTIVKLITQYLFNKDEENMMKDIISKIQEYDMHLREQESDE